MNSLAMIFAIASVATSGIALLAIRRFRLADLRCVHLEQLVIDAERRIGDIEERISLLARDGKTTGRRIDRLVVEQGRRTPGPRKNGFGEAIALIRHGASADQLIDTCGISHAEARLVETLYRQDVSKAASAPNKFVLVDAHLEAAEHRSES